MVKFLALPWASFVLYQPDLNLNINRKINIKQSCFVLCYTDLMRAISGTMALTSSES